MSHRNVQGIIRDVANKSDEVISEKETSDVESCEAGSVRGDFTVVGPKVSASSASVVTALDKTSSVKRFIRGSDISPSLEMPNMPTGSSPQPKTVSPRIRPDMFRRKDSPGINPSWANSSR
ncbi:hypothetical protein AB6A40_004232 [Gnathostoma spinigerum]|uniref:Uncharacterized protein n=1 Tax=Gnathostoma spinigerum TaxID=75299 RepID=A0ABD6EC22_9BILA